MVSLFIDLRIGILDELFGSLSCPRVWSLAIYLWVVPLFEISNPAESHENIPPLFDKVTLALEITVERACLVTSLMISTRSWSTLGRLDK